MPLKSYSAATSSLKAKSNMQQLNQLFKIATAIAMAGWVLIIAAPGWVLTEKVISTGVTGLLAVLYVYLLVGARSLDTEPVRGSFGSLKGVINLFKSPRVILAGWVHFLAFDLMVALWIRANAAPLGFSHWWLIPIYLLTLMFGPAGLLAYLLVRATIT
jgi:Domain of unknown function (DUF4281)